MSKSNILTGVLTSRGLEIKKKDIVNKYESRHREYDNF